MKPIVYILLLCLMSSCQKTTTASSSALLTAELHHPVGPIPLEDANLPMFTTELYEASLFVDTQADGTYALVIDMVLKNDAYFVSPNAKRDFSGKFSVLWEGDKSIKLLNPLDEYPLSVEENDPHPFVGGDVNWVRQNTTYTQHFQALDTGDFEVIGHIQFTIEPKCTLEKLPFIIKRKNGKIRVEKFQC
ncbi:hypothetical protein ACU8DI_06430 [Psychroserpens sp. BH13MA-6]